MTDLRLAYDVTVSLPLVGFTGPNGASFLGWATTPDGPVEYDDGADIHNLSAVAEDIIILYAKWNRGYFNVVFDANGGTGSMSPQTFALDLPQQLFKCSFGKAGHIFAGWAIVQGGAIAFSDEEEVWNLAVSGQSQTLYAVWRESAPGLVIRYYDISSPDILTWTQSENAMISYFSERTPTLEEDTLSWGESLTSGFVNSKLDSSYENRRIAAGFASLQYDDCRFHGKYASGSQNYFATYLFGYFAVNEACTYTFGVLADNFIVVYIDGVKVCEAEWQNDGVGSILLYPGLHRIAIVHYEYSGGQGFSVQWKKSNDSSYTKIPSSVLMHASD